MFQAPKSQVVRERVIERGFLLWFAAYALLMLSFFVVNADAQGAAPTECWNKHGQVQAEGLLIDEHLRDR